MDLLLKGNLNVLKGKLREKYGELTDDDLQVAEGGEDQLIGNLQKRLGKSEAEIKQEIKNLLS
ncbi:CsbD family protein [Algoriphagus sediminis]|uniref:CsbD family protein n=1 Tax=Algoriphagus sediminis TaxID=3057113 RepID=A0ABT7YFC8_9BACT|nr:CsbD family protein [Algoriphagus sediminis]MDN3205232.1 CsbD family protein [Algoriphagus sediminis]